MLIHTVLQYLRLCGISVIQLSNQALSCHLLTYVAEYMQILDVYPIYILRLALDPVLCYAT